VSNDSYAAADHYNRVTAAWGLLLGDELHYGVFDDPAEPLPIATGRLTSLMIEKARLEPGLTLLDVGCGTGAPARRLATDHGVRVTGITTSEYGVASAQAESVGVDGVEFELRDGQDNGFPEASFDRSWALESSHLMPDRAAFVAESARVLKPGGRLVLCDIIRVREIPFSEVRQRREEFAVLRTEFGAARMDGFDQYTSLMAANGLAVDPPVDLTRQTRPTFDAWLTNLDQHRAEVTEVLGEDDVEAFRRGCQILADLWDEGTLGYGLLSGMKV
jgi:cyclopropane fatty-acyl-phospholipid synthase-like methyltransferase